MNNKQASEILKTISDESRLTIIKELSKKNKMCANDFLPLVNCKQATLSFHLSGLVNAGLLNSKKKGNKVFYSINRKNYDALLNFLNFAKHPVKQPVPISDEDFEDETKTDKVSNKTKEVKKIEVTKTETKKEVVRVVDTPIINKKNEKKKEEPLPIFLL